MDLTNDQRFQVLMAELKERYDASHKIRERSMQFTLWISGMALGLAWLLISDGKFSVSQRCALTLLVLALYLGTSNLLRGLHRGAGSNRAAMLSVEKALGMYEKGIYLPEQTLLPDAYSNTKTKWSHDSRTLPCWTTLVAVIIVILIWATPKATCSNAPCKDLQNTVKDVSHG